MPFYFGGALALLAATGAISKRRSDLGAAAMVAVSLLMTLGPCARTLGELPGLALLQFPWRFLALGTVGASLLAASATRSLVRQVRRRDARVWLPAALAALILFDAAPFMGAIPSRLPSLDPRVEARLAALTPFARVAGLSVPPANPDIEVSSLSGAYPEYLTPIVRAEVDAHTGDDRAWPSFSVVGLFEERRFRFLAPEHWLPYAEFRPDEAAVGEALTFFRAGGRIHVELPGRPGTLLVREQWFPGWYVDGNNPEIQPGADGFIRVRVLDDRSTLDLVTR